MKIRQGFVSNSSSSSFIVARAQIGDDKWKQLVEFLDSYNDPQGDDDAEDDDEDYYEEMYPSIGKNYIYIDTSDVNTSRLYNRLAALGISADDYMTASS